MPEFMLSSDASNANYSSTMVAEGPAMRMFQRLQAEQVADDLQVMWRVVANAVAAGPIAERSASRGRNHRRCRRRWPCAISCKRRSDFKIENAAGILSPQTWSQRLGLDYGQEQANLAAHAAASDAGRQSESRSRSTPAALPLDASAANSIRSGPIRLLKMIV